MVRVEVDVQLDAPVGGTGEEQVDDTEPVAVLVRGDQSEAVALA